MTNLNSSRLGRAIVSSAKVTRRNRFDVRWTSSLAMSALVLFVFAGCETSNYDPLIVKTKLKELEAKIDAVGGGAAPA
ncbi:MAG: hypothetical protein ACKO9H_03825, partial [Planctomycetota bacterium]